MAARSRPPARLGAPFARGDAGAWRCRLAPLAPEQTHPKLPSVRFPSLRGTAQGSAPVSVCDPVWRGQGRTLGSEAGVDDRACTSPGGTARVLLSRWVERGRSVTTGWRNEPLRLVAGQVVGRRWIFQRRRVFIRELREQLPLSRLERLRPLRLELSRAIARHRFPPLLR
jgi:hypothetical protein